MRKPSDESILQATERVKKRLPFDKIRSISKYKDISMEDYEKLIKNAETISLLILEAFFSEKQNKL